MQAAPGERAMMEKRGYIDPDWTPAEEPVKRAQDLAALADDPTQRLAEAATSFPEKKPPAAPQPTQ
jgi:hypothetical protein